MALQTLRSALSVVKEKGVGGAFREARSRGFLALLQPVRCGSVDCSDTPAISSKQAGIVKVVRLDRRMGSQAIPRRLIGKVAVVTASTQGIGLAIVERLGLEGASVVVSSRKQKNVDEALAQLQAKGIEAIGVACHVSKADQRRSLIKAALDKYGRIDILVSNAAANPAVLPISEMPEEIIDKLWETNVKAGILLVQEAVPYLKKGSSITFISSIAGFNPSPGGLQMYGVTKTALLGLTKALATELGPKIRVNSVNPGFVPTHFADYMTRTPEIRREFESQTTLKRLGKPSDMAAAVAYLVSDDASYVTGENLVVAGGMPSRL